MMNNSLRTIQTAIARDLLAQFIEEKADQWGFVDSEDVKVVLEGLPETIPIKFKFKQEQEVEVTEH